MGQKGENEKESKKEESSEELQQKKNGFKETLSIKDNVVNTDAPDHISSSRLLETKKNNGLSNSLEKEEALSDVSTIPSNRNVLRGHDTLLHNEVRRHARTTNSYMPLFLFEWFYVMG